MSLELVHSVELPDEAHPFCLSTTRLTAASTSTLMPFHLAALEEISESSTDLGTDSQFHEEALRGVIRQVEVYMSDLTSANLQIMNEQARIRGEEARQATELDKAEFDARAARSSFRLITNEGA